MIVTVTMNPAIDKTVDIDRFERGDLNRIERVELDAGGKGINVSKTIRELGGESIAMGFVGGTSGTIIKHVLADQNIQTDFVEVKGETRTNLKIVEENGEVTELNEPGPEVSKEQLEDLLDRLNGYANPYTLFVLAGSIPAGIPTDIYRRITEEVHRKGAKVLLDADGPLFAESLKAAPDMLKPNRSELERYYQMDYRASEQELVSMGEKLLDHGTDMVAISLGQMGALFLTGDKRYRCPGLRVKAHSTVGAGDALVGAMAYAWNEKLPLETCIRLCMGASAGAVTSIGTKPPHRSLVDELMQQVELLEIQKYIDK
ncbi:1-phosphofructokinase [Lacrimispora celerecrescens]|uniref:Tagatose-6-phosphate kinase n=1 Tax=Lacrimispora celerecrescens TaxID=29354 RepID=A0A084JFT9_9FIRM|nr:1-phosphofructokinase [Lacrimispora celerecrescens]KEZ87823.1 phosphofructokinase [Lacrimispora celerecrescens]